MKKNKNETQENRMKILFIRKTKRGWDKTPLFEDILQNVGT